MTCTIACRLPCGRAEHEMEVVWCPSEDLGVIKVESGMLDDHMPNEVVKAFQRVYQQLVEPTNNSAAANATAVPAQPTYQELVTAANSSEDGNATMLY